MELEKCCKKNTEYQYVVFYSLAKIGFDTADNEPSKIGLRLANVYKC